MKNGKKKPEITDELINHVSLLRERIVLTNTKILTLYSKQLQDLNDLHDIMSDYELEKNLEIWYLDIVNFIEEKHTGCTPVGGTNLLQTLNCSFTTIFSCLIP